MFTRIGAAAFKKDLTNTIALCDVLHQPHQQFKSIHIAGTNGKGSTSHMLAAILQTAGYKTGLYTSPHLRDFRERIRVNGEMITEQDVIDFVERYKVHFDAIEPSFFEWTVALCFYYFAQQQVDIAVIETGLGGRLDSTNIIRPELSVITNIGWDHMDMLGDTLPKIAFEKAGIIKPSVPVVIGETDAETLPVFKQQSTSMNAAIHLASEEIQLHNIQHSLTHTFADAEADGAPWLNHLKVDLPGIYQEHNLKTVLCAVQQLRALGYIISDEAIRNGLHSVTQLTGLHGRWQVLQNDPLVICDTGHNINGIQYIVQQLQTIPYAHLHMVVGMVKDKDVSTVLRLLPQDATYYFCKAAIPRGLDAHLLQEQAAACGLNGKSYDSVSSALLAAKQAAAKNDLIFVGGSTFVVAEVV